MKKKLEEYIKNMKSPFVDGLKEVQHEKIPFAKQKITPTILLSLQTTGISGPSEYLQHRFLTHQKFSRSSWKKVLLKNITICKNTIKNHYVQIFA